VKVQINASALMQYDNFYLDSAQCFKISRYTSHLNGGTGPAGSAEEGFIPTQIQIKLFTIQTIRV